MAKKVKFIPSQMDPLAGSSTRADREHPIWLFLQDAGILISMLRYLPFIVVPFKTTDKHDELYLSLGSARDALIHGMLFLLEAGLLLIVPVAILVLPGGLLFILTALFVLLIRFICIPLKGSRMTCANMDRATQATAKLHEDERWVFINGCMTGRAGLQQNVDRLSATFGRAVVGLHNQTYGVIADLIECLIQRCFAYNNTDVRAAFDHVKACLADPDVSKVILIGHSQGGIIASMVVDRLLIDLPYETISKLEVYTFGSAASHFSNPRYSLNRSSPTDLNDTPYADRCIPHIEHYVNELDMVPRWGVLYNVTEVLNNRYNGKVFVQMGVTGHMFNQHYLNTMFPLDEAKASEFLDQIVDVDEALANKREKKAMQQMSDMRLDSEMGSSKSVEPKIGDMLPFELVVNSEIRSYDPDQLLMKYLEPIAATNEKAKGRTVRQLSRLWKYVDGGSPALYQKNKLVNGQDHGKNYEDLSY